MIPVITLIGLQVPIVVGGSVIVESDLQRPGHRAVVLPGDRTPRLHRRAGGALLRGGSSCCRTSPSTSRTPTSTRGSGTADGASRTSPILARIRGAAERARASRNGRAHGLALLPPQAAGGVRWVHRARHALRAPSSPTRGSSVSAATGRCWRPDHYDEQVFGDENAGPSLEPPVGHRRARIDDQLSRIIYGARISIVIGLSAVVHRRGARDAVGTCPATSEDGSTRSSSALLTSGSRSPPIVLLIYGVRSRRRYPGRQRRRSGSPMILVLHRSSRRARRASSAAPPSRRRTTSTSTRRARSARPNSGSSSAHRCRTSCRSSIVLATRELGTAILAEAAISFLGFGIPPPLPVAGASMLHHGRSRCSARVPGAGVLAGLRDLPAGLRVQHVRRRAARRAGSAAARRALASRRRAQLRAIASRRAAEGRRRRRSRAPSRLASTGVHAVVVLHAGRTPSTRTPSATGGSGPWRWYQPSANSVVETEIEPGLLRTRRWRRRQASVTVPRLTPADARTTARRTALATFVLRASCRRRSRATTAARKQLSKRRHSSLRIKSRPRPGCGTVRGLATSVAGVPDPRPDSRYAEARAQAFEARAHGGDQPLLLGGDDVRRRLRAEPLVVRASPRCGRPRPRRRRSAFASRARSASTSNRPVSGTTAVTPSSTAVATWSFGAAAMSATMCSGRARLSISMYGAPDSSTPRAPWATTYASMNLPGSTFFSARMLRIARTTSMSSLHLALGGRVRSSRSSPRGYAATISASSAIDAIFDVSACQSSSVTNGMTGCSSRRQRSST